MGKQGCNKCDKHEFNVDGHVKKSSEMIVVRPLEADLKVQSVFFRRCFGSLEPAQERAVRFGLDDGTLPKHERHLRNRPFPPTAPGFFLKGRPQCEEVHTKQFFEYPLHICSVGSIIAL